MKILDDLNDHQRASTLEDALHNFNGEAPIGLVVPLVIMGRTLGTLMADLAEIDNPRMSPELRKRAREACDVHVRELCAQHQHLRHVVQRLYPDHPVR